MSSLLLLLTKVGQETPLLFVDAELKEYSTAPELVGMYIYMHNRFLSSSVRSLPARSLLP